MNCPNCNTAGQTANTPCNHCGAIVVALQQQVVIPPPPPLVYTVRQQPQPVVQQPQPAVQRCPYQPAWGWFCLALLVGGFWLHWGLRGSSSDEVIAAAKIIVDADEDEAKATRKAVNDKGDEVKRDISKAVNDEAAATRRSIWAARQRQLNAIDALGRQLQAKHKITIKVVK